MVHNELHAIDLGIIAAYLIAMVAIGVVVVKKVPRLLIPLLLPMFMMGWHTKIGLARVTRAKTVTMRAKNMTVNLDGKLLRVDEAHYELLPGAVRMKKPRL